LVAVAEQVDESGEAELVSLGQVASCEHAQKGGGQWRCDLDHGGEGIVQRAFDLGGSQAVLVATVVGA
jgi:hypothetical protein